MGYCKFNLRIVGLLDTSKITMPVCIYATKNINFIAVI